MARMIRKILAAAAACAAVSLPAAAQTLDGLSVEVGRGQDETNLLRVAIQSKWRKEWPAGQEWRFSGYWELSVGAWDNHDNSAADFAFTPTFRFERYAPEVSPYVEAAIGFHIISRHISADRYFSTNFQFGDHVGVGVRFGEQRRYDLQLRAQHISNGGISQPNPGINFLLLRFQLHLQ